MPAFFAGTADGLKQIIYNYYGNTNSEGPIIFAAALSTVLVNPIQERVQRWSEQRSRKTCSCSGTICPRSLATCARRPHWARCSTRFSPGSTAASAPRTPAIVNGCVLRARGPSIEEVENWRSTRFAQDYKSDICEPTDKLFPIRVPLVPSSDDEEPIGFLLVGPRPDGSIPSRDEQKALKEVSESVARAIRTVIKREAREREVAELISDNARRIEALEALLSPGPLATGRQRPRSA